MPHTILAIPYDDNLRVDEIVREGVPALALSEIADLLRIDLDRLAAAMRIPRRTLDRRLAAPNKDLPFSEGNRTVRIGRLIAMALDVFEDQERAARWFTEKLAILGNVSPLVCCATDAGARVVEQALGRIEHA